ncbi:MAG: TolC family protein [Bacteroidota bacterium]
MYLKIKSTLLSALCLVGVLKGQSLQNLSLSSAVRIALENKPALKTLDLDAQISAARVAEIKLKKQTQVSGKVDVQVNPLLPASVIPVGAFNPSAPSDATATVRFGTLWQNTVGLNASQTLYDPSISAQIREQAFQTQLTEVQRAQTAVDIQVAVARAYYGVLVSAEEIRFALQDSSRSQFFLNEVKNRKEGGKSLQTDVNQAQINLNAATLKLAQLRLNQALLRKSLLYQMGINPDHYAEIQLSENLESLLQQPGNTSDATAGGPEVIEQNRLEIKQLQLDNTLQGLKIATEKTRTAPKLTANASLGLNNYSDTAPFVTKNAWFGYGYVSLNLAVPISEYWQLKKHLPQYELKQLQNAQKTADLKQQYRNDYEQARTNLLSARLALDTRKRDLVLVRENLDLYKICFSEGVLLASAVTDAEQTLQQTQYNYLKSAYDALIAALDMRKATGAVK